VFAGSTYVGFNYTGSAQKFYLLDSEGNTISTKVAFDIPPWEIAKVALEMPRKPGDYTLIVKNGMFNKTIGSKKLHFEGPKITIKHATMKVAPSFKETALLLNDITLKNEGDLPGFLDGIGIQFGDHLSGGRFGEFIQPGEEKIIGGHELNGKQVTSRVFERESEFGLKSQSRNIASFYFDIDVLEIFNYEIVDIALVDTGISLNSTAKYKVPTSEICIASGIFKHCDYYKNE
tara:strand:- start:980 stop:1678 length:699 start_codon:yes stop_codon:yes gene_type:complete